MSMGQEIVEKLEQLGLGTFSGEPRTLFLDEMPEDPDVCGAVFETGGSPPEFGFGEEGIKFENPTIAIWFRGEAHDSAGPHAKIRQAYSELSKIQAEDVGSTPYLEVTPLQPPFILERDDSRRVIWTFNFLAYKEPS